LRIGLPLELIIRNTIYKQFCGGESIEDCEPAMKELKRSKVTTILDYSVEGKAAEGSFDANCAEILRTVQYARGNDHTSICVFISSGLVIFDLLANMDAKQSLSDADNADFGRIYDRIGRICAACFAAGQPVLIDAEHSWVQDTTDDIAREMMEKYNKEGVIVYNTYQLYRHDKFASLQADFAYAQTQNFYLGAKIVRGAYKIGRA